MKLGIYCAGGLGRESFELANRLNDRVPLWDEIFFVSDIDLGGGGNIYSSTISSRRSES